MYLAYAALHESMVWDARIELKVVDIIEAIWKINELLAHSMD